MHTCNASQHGIKLALAVTMYDSYNLNSFAGLECENVIL